MLSAAPCPCLAGLNRRSPPISPPLPSASVGVCAVGAAGEPALRPPPRYRCSRPVPGDGLCGGVRTAHRLGGRDRPLCAPLTTTAKPSIARQMRIRSLFLSTAWGEPLPFHHHSRKKSSESDLHTHRPCVGGFVHFWWVFKYICFGGREKVKKQ